MLTHVILTRFNIPTRGKEGIIRSSPNWLANRFELFDQFCFPSVRDQTDRRFSWFVYFDEETPEPYMSRALGYQKQCQELKLRFGSLDDFSLDRIQDDVRSCALNAGDWTVTTRLDNDDALPRDFVQRIAGATEIGRRQVLNFTNGFIWNDGRIFAHSHRSNAFASLSEPYEGLKTVLTAPHMELETVAPIKQIDGAAGWMQVVHGQNISNRVRGRRIQALDIRQQFSLSSDVPIRDQGVPALIAENLILHPARSLRDGAIKVAKTLNRIRGRRS